MAAESLVGRDIRQRAAEHGDRAIAIGLEPLVKLRDIDIAGDFRLAFPQSLGCIDRSIEQLPSKLGSISHHAAGALRTGNPVVLRMRHEWIGLIQPAGFLNWISGSDQNERRTGTDSRGGARQRSAMVSALNICMLLPSRDEPSIVA